MPPKAKLPAPIDRPLSRAYLREFTGWSTQYPPGLSDPTSLRVMENMLINRDGSIRVRPGLRYLSYEGDGKALSQHAVGSHEVFLLNDGTKAYLFAVREANNSVGFRAARFTGDPAKPFRVHRLYDPEIGFPNDPAPLSVDTTYVKYLQIDNKIFALSDAGNRPRIFHVGATKKAVTPQTITRPTFDTADRPRIRHPKKNSLLDPVANPPLNNAAQRTSRTLRPTIWDAANTPYSIGYFYTFSSEIGETGPSPFTVIKVRRRWSAWDWDLPNDYSEPANAGGTAVEGEDPPEENDNPNIAADQLFIYPALGAFLQAMTEGATHLNVYALMWSNQDPVPVEGLLVGRRELTPGLAHQDAWVRHTPAGVDGSRSMPVPTESNRRNYTTPPKASQGLVAADRMVVVLDPDEAGVIKWTGNQVGDYTNFTANRGGGYKTLTSGNMYVPAAVKLWQNPESKDTLTVLCLGVDGYSTSYYMAPAAVSSQTDATPIMAFEETTATAGTVAPYGNEVLNNALFHPLETELVKSTASNYNINHKAMTDSIANQWRQLANKFKIVSSQLDNRLYYIVHNPAGAPLEPNCRGNEIWVLDVAGKDTNGTWSRWLVQAQSLRKIEVDGQVRMSITRPEGIYCFDEDRITDDYVTGARAVASRPIPWKLETNTQGANRAHDAWCHLQQATITLGNFLGRMRYGIRGYDMHGRPVERAKIVRDDKPVPPDGLPWDLTDHLLTRADIMEWRFFAESVTEGGAVQPSSGQINLVQYRYTPVTVNVGYEYGSVETFEYARNVSAGNDASYTNGVPVPMVDTRRP